MILLSLAWFVATCVLPIVVAVCRGYPNIWYIGFGCLVAAFICAPVGLFALYKALAYNTKFDITLCKKGN